MVPRSSPVRSARVSRSFSNCAGCHGADGEGGVGYQFSEGQVLLTFPHMADQMRYVYYGTEGYNAEGIDVYGNPDREGGAHVTGERGVMPTFGEQLTNAEIVAVVCHERYTIAGADPTSRRVRRRATRRGVRRSRRCSKVSRPARSR